MTVEEAARAKINLTLHVTGQRDDGYHTLDSLVVFAATRDVVKASHSDQLTLEITGPEAASLNTGEDNLVLQAARLFGPQRGAKLELVKYLPVAAGIGGGSADAAATLRALSRLWGMPIPDADAVLSLGADVPVCLAAIPARMRGIGDVLGAVPEMPEYAGMVLVNPRVSVSTPEVFKRLENRNNPAMDETIPAFSTAIELSDWLKSQRNDLQAPAIELQPVIADVLRSIEGTDSLFARMSGSGATCFGLYKTEYEAKAAHASLYVSHPQWWSQWFGLNPVEITQLTRATT